MRANVDTQMQQDRPLGPSTGGLWVDFWRKETRCSATQVAREWFGRTGAGVSLVALRKQQTLSGTHVRPKLCRVTVPKDSRFVDRTGQVFNRLTFIQYLGKNKHRHSMWLVQCQCGMKKEMASPGIVSGNTQSCGCLKTEVTTTHGQTGSPTYKAWIAMIRRCYDDTYFNYASYGGVGKLVCDRYRFGDGKGKCGLTCLIEDIGERPNNSYTLDRINGALGYVDKNLRWAVHQKQQENKLSSIKIMLYGVEYPTLIAACRSLDMKNSLQLSLYVKKHKCTYQEAFDHYLALHEKKVKNLDDFDNRSKIVPLPTHSRFVDLSNRLYGWWTVLGFVGRIGCGHSRWLVRCVCGQERIITSQVLTGGFSTSCGCRRITDLRSIKTTHGDSRSVEHSIWQGIKKRCEKGVELTSRDHKWRPTICKRWLEGDGKRGGYACFLADMKRRPSPEHSVDRIDGTKGYEPGNCRWATPQEQSDNKKSNIKIVVDGVDCPSLSAACRHIGASGFTLQPYMRRHNCTHQVAFDNLRRLWEARGKPGAVAPTPYVSPKTRRWLTLPSEQSPQELAA